MSDSIKSFSEFLVEFRNPCEPADSPMTPSEIRGLLQKYKSLFKQIGLQFEFSNHVHGSDDARIDHPRNKPPISVCEFEFVMNSFLKKWVKQLISVMNDVIAGKMKQRGGKGGKIPDGEFEGTIMSKSTNINIVFAVKPNQRGLPRFRLVTVIRKPNFKVTKGAKIFVEEYDLEYTSDLVYEVD